MNICKVISDHKLEWIALSPDNKRFVAAAKTLKEVIKISKEKNVDEPTVFKAPDLRYFMAG